MESRGSNLKKRFCTCLKLNGFSSMQPTMVKTFRNLWSSSFCIIKLVPIRGFTTFQNCKVIWRLCFTICRFLSLPCKPPSPSPHPTSLTLSIWKPVIVCITFSIAHWTQKIISMNMQFKFLIRVLKLWKVSACWCRNGRRILVDLLIPCLISSPASSQNWLQTIMNSILKKSRSCCKKEKNNKIILMNSRRCLRISRLERLCKLCPLVFQIQNKK